MNRIFPVTAFCMLLAATAAAQTTPAVPEGPLTITSGEGIVKRAPDRAWVNVSVESRAKSPREAQKLNADAMSAVLQKLKGAGLNGDAKAQRDRRGLWLSQTFDGMFKLDGLFDPETGMARHDDIEFSGQRVVEREFVHGQPE